MVLWVEKIHMHVISLKMRESARQKERVQFSQHVGYAIVPRTETNGRATESALAGEQFRNHARLLDEFFKRRSRVFNRLLPRSAGAHTIWPGFESNAHAQTPWLFTVSGCCTLSSLRRCWQPGWLAAFLWLHTSPSSQRAAQDVVCVCFGEAPAAPMPAFGCKNN